MDSLNHHDSVTSGVKIPTIPNNGIHHVKQLVTSLPAFKIFNYEVIKVSFFCHTNMKLEFIGNPAQLSVQTINKTNAGTINERYSIVSQVDPIVVWHRNIPAYTYSFFNLPAVGEMGHFKMTLLDNSENPMTELPVDESARQYYINVLATNNSSSLLLDLDLL
tara:strand:- start:1129 stop:1617 length:489 start_codon:yes stop_codon:yes gene_type:complete